VAADHVTFLRFLALVTASHLVTYFVAGILAYSLVDYATLFQSEGFSCLMRPLDSKWIAAGPGLQVIRGLIFALALYPFRSVFLADRRGWLKLWGLLVGLAIFSTAGAAPGSVEGMIYTKIPISSQLRGLPEILLQTLAFSVLLIAWHRHPHRAWAVVMGTLALLVILMSAAGVFLSPLAGAK
jgi:hypothetical protein